MKMTKTLLAAVAVMSVAQAHAGDISLTPYDGTAASAHSQVTGAIENSFDSAMAFGSYSQADQTLAADGAYAVRPAGGSGNFMWVGPSTTQTLSFEKGASYFGFLWGSPDGFNEVTFTTNKGSTTFTGFQLVDKAFGQYPSGDQTMSAYLNFSTSKGEYLKSVTFASGGNSFETDNHAFTAAVPEPETYALMLAGLLAIGFIARRRGGR